MSPSSPQRGTIRGGIHCLTSGGNRMLSKQQTRRLLHYAIEGKFTSSSNTKESGIWIEGKLEDFFVRSLEQQNKNQKDYFSLEEILYVAEIGLAQAFQLPEFDATRCCIFEEQSTSRRSSSIGNIGRPTRVNSVVISTKETIDLSKIPALAPIPLFQFDLILKTTKTSNGNNLAQVIFEPSMETIQTTIREVIQSFALVFEDLDDLSSHEDIQAVLTFAENIRTSKIKSKILGNAIHLQNFQEEKEKKEGIVTKEKEDKSTNSSNCSSLPSLHERLIEIAAADEEFCEMRNEIEQLLLQAFEGATNFTKCFEEMLQWYKQNEITDFELFRILFYEKKYTLQQMEHQVTMFRHQIQQIEQLCKTKNIFFLEFHTKCFKNAFFPSPKRCLNRLQSLLPTLLHGKCLQFLYYIRNASNQIQRPLTIDMDDFTNYLKHLNEIHDQIQEKEFELTFIHDFYLLLDKKLQFQVPPDTTESFELCDPEFNALKSQVNDAMVKREVDIQEYVPMVVQAISMVRILIGY
jgi:hypothetical protein